MARVKLTEYRAKQLLTDDYAGLSVSADSIKHVAQQLQPKVSYVAKVDQGIKKRGKQGLIALNVTTQTVGAALEKLHRKGFNRFIVEQMTPHDDEEERYVSFERTREGVLVSYSPHGGIDVEDEPGNIVQSIDPKKIPLPQALLSHIINTMQREHLSFVEINPLLIRGDTPILLDAAVLADSAAAHLASWSEDDIVDARTLTDTERVIAELNENSPASFSFRILNPNGAIWLLLSGGGASITIADEAHNHNKSSLIGNYGEYSGGPSGEETYLYTKQVLMQMLASKAPRRALVIAGGVANFTDVKKTFGGIIQALTEQLEECKKAHIRVFVRRGGPNEAEGLAMMRTFLEEHNLFGTVHGSDSVLTDVITEALEYIDA